LFCALLFGKNDEPCFFLILDGRLIVHIKILGIEIKLDERILHVKKLGIE